MSIFPSDESEHSTRSFAALDAHGLSIVHDDLPDRWIDGDSAYLLHRIDATSWKVAFDGIVLGILSYVPSDLIGGPPTWHISDPLQQVLGVGASWMSWEDAVANLVDYRRGQ